ncbi:MAG: BON domain-containing protein [Acidobacteria bacterium]|nr:BON domain-containing protein [Acidobacteriota bacterium]
MSQDEEQRRSSRIEVETPAGRREVVQSQVTRYPAERTGMSTGTVAAIALTAIAATAIIFLFLMNRGDDSSNTNVNIRTAAATQPTPLPQTPIIVQQQPMPQQTPIIIQQPAAPPAAAPVIIQQPAASAPSAPPANPTDDLTLQTKLDKAFSDDRDIVNASINATIVNGKVMLMGTVKSDDLKRRAEKLAYQIKGVRSVENKITVDPNMP